MKIRPLLLIVCSAVLLCSAACGKKTSSGEKTEAESTVNGTTAPAPDDAEPTRIGTIRIQNDGRGTPEDGNGVRRMPFVNMTDVDFEYKDEILTYQVRDFQIASLTATDQAEADELGIPLNQAVTMIQINFSAWNNTKEDLYFYPADSTLILNGQISYSCRVDLCGGMNGLYRKQLGRGGILYFILADQKPENVRTLELRFSRPQTSEKHDAERLGIRAFLSLTL